MDDKTKRGELRVVHRAGRREPEPPREVRVVDKRPTDRDLALSEKGLAVDGLKRELADLATLVADRGHTLTPGHIVALRHAVRETSALLRGEWSGDDGGGIRPTA